MDNLKIWMVEVFVKKMGPSLIKGALAGLVGYVAAHHGLLASFGLTYDPTQNTLNLDLDTFGKWILIVGTGGVTALFTALQHHTAAVVVGAPQSGDLRKMDPIDPILNGERKGDPK
jgi:hypothetical protein